MPAYIFCSPLIFFLPVTWDPSFFNSTNTTIKITGSYYNYTTDKTTDEAFSSGALAASWSFYAWTVNSTILAGMPKGSGVNISLAMTAVVPATAGPAAATPSFAGPLVTVAKPAGYVPEPHKAPSGPALYIGLPTVLGFVAVVAVGTCWWNRGKRRIGLGNVMGGRRAGYGVGKSRRQRLFSGAGAGGRRERKEQGIRLMERDVHGAGAAGREEVYRDEVDGGAEARPGVRVPGPEADDFDFTGVPRRDSDALGSLAGSPTEERHPDGVGRAPTGNAFRDELSRQERERF